MFKLLPRGDPRADEACIAASGVADRSLRPPAASTSGEGSVIASGVRIAGRALKLISRGTLRLQGVIEGDVEGVEVIIGEKARVTGWISGRHVVVAGKVFGRVSANKVTLEATSLVCGDIHHVSLAIKEGAQFKGRSYRAPDEAEFNAVAYGRDTTACTPVPSHGPRAHEAAACRVLSGACA
jgi:cytoskeletal protein CcmA (bactofilin family)